MKCKPVVLNSLNEPAIRLERIESRPSDEKTESWLQQLIFENPTLLPVEEFDESFAPLISLGREISTPIGSIDNLYISPVGQITIVETKLWKNPDKQRTVVAQIIDYAKELSKWSYDDLDRAVLKAARQENLSEKKSLDQLISPYLSDAGLTLPDFQERVISNLQSGEFLLLIVGDKIAPNVAFLSEAIHGSPGLDFTIGLIELQLHPLNEYTDWPLLVIPDIVGRTVEHVRGVIKIQYETEKPKVAVEINEEPLPERKGHITKEIFLQRIPDDLQPIYDKWLNSWLQAKDFNIYWGTSGFSLRVRQQNKFETVFYGLPDWGVTLVKESDADRRGASREQYQKYLDSIADIPIALNTLGQGKTYIKHENLTADELEVILRATDKFAKDVKD